MEDKIVEYISTASPISVTVLILLIIYQLIKGRSIMHIFRGEHSDQKKLDEISLQLKTIASNHLHELPDIRKDITEILTIQKEMTKEQTNQGQRMVRVETMLGIGIPNKN